MCTVVLWPDDRGGFWLAGNRDEARWRVRAEPPAVRALDAGLRALAPRDPEGGGTWTGVNDHGVALSLLNHYQADRQAPSPAAPLSRGQVVQGLLDARDLGEIAGRVGALPTARLRPFVLLAAAPSWGAPRQPHSASAPSVAPAAALEVVWDGYGLHVQPVALPLMRTSAGFDIARARRHRGALWEGVVTRLGPDPSDAAVEAELLGFLRGHAPEKGRVSVCKHGTVAGTVSLTLLRVTEAQVSVRYAPGPPCVTDLGASMALDASRG